MRVPAIACCACRITRAAPPERRPVASGGRLALKLPHPSRGGKSRTRPYIEHELHTVVIRSAAAFRWDPRDDLVGVLNVAGFAVYTVRWVEADALAVRRRRVLEHFVDVGRAEILARTAEF